MRDFRLLIAAMLAAILIPLVPGQHAFAAGAVETLPRITVETVGATGPDVILIPGLATPREVWRPLAAALSGEARLHLVELRGFAAGDPGINAQGEIIPGLVQALADYIAANKLEHVSVIGHSLGGLAALDLAQKKPAGIDRVMVVDALPYIGALFAGPTATVAMVEPQARAMREQLFGLAAAGQSMPAATHQALSEGGKAKIAEWTRAVNLRVVGHALYEDLTLDVRPGLATMTVPVTVLYPLTGTDAEQARTRALYDGAYAPVPEHEMVTVADSAHFIMLDQPARFEAEVRAFLGLAE